MACDYCSDVRDKCQKCMCGYCDLTCVCIHCKECRQWCYCHNTDSASDCDSECDAPRP
jgi:hypothetical protein